MQRCLCESGKREVSLEIRQGDTPKLVPTRTRCVYRFIVQVRGRLTRTSTDRLWSP